MYLYLDECYNTGNNFLDKTQPFFTYGGWVISDCKINDANKIIQKFKAKNRNNSNELKSKSFTSHKGIRQVNVLLTQLMNECNAIPLVMVYEKNFVLACKATEIFFDHETNSKVNSFLTFPNEYEYYKCIKKEINNLPPFDEVRPFLKPISLTKRGLAETIYNDQQFCSLFAKIINDKNINNISIQTLINNLHNTFLNQGYNEIALIFDCSNFKIQEIVYELDNNIIDETTSYNEYLLVKPSIYEMISYIKNMDKQITLVVDTLGAQQNNQFNDLQNMMDITVRVIEDSQSEPLIMASDLLVGQVARQLNNLVNSVQKYNLEQLKLFHKCLTPTLSPFDDAPSLWNYKLSYNTFRKLVKAVDIPVKISDYDETLRHFPDYFMTR